MSLPRPVRVNGNMIFKGQKLTIGMDLGDNWSCYCVLENSSGTESGDEVLWAATAQVRHTAGEPGAGRGIARRVARGSGAVAPRNRITERAHPGIRGANGENRQGKLPARRITQTGEGSRNADRADVCADAGRPASVPEESRGRLFSRVVPWAQGLRGEPATDEYQQGRRPLLEDHAGAGGALHPGTLWRRQ